MGDLNINEKDLIIVSEDAKTSHLQLLSSLPSKITEIYNYDILSSHAKHDVACRLIAKTIGANSVSLLLYKGNENNLYCAGGYIDPDESKTNVKLMKADSSSNILSVMKYVSELEFLKNTDRDSGLDKLYAEYLKFPFSNPISLSKGEFQGFPYKNYTKYLKDYTRYKMHFKDEVYEIVPNKTITGLYYYVLSHHSERETWMQSLYRNRASLFKNRFFICDLNNVKNKFKTCCNNLKRKLKVSSETDAYYIGIPLQVNDRPIGILRVLLKRNITLKIPRIGSLAESLEPFSIRHSFNSAEEVCKYVTEVANFENIALILSLHLNNAFYSHGMRQIALKNNLHNEFTNLNVVANELTEVVNCYGCVIRFTDSKMSKASIKGYSESILEYYLEVSKRSDPYINSETGKFRTVFIDLFYPGEANVNTQKIESVKIDFSQNEVNSLSYQYFDDRYKLISSDDWKGKRLKKMCKELKSVFNSNERMFYKFDLQSIIIIPIKDKEYGFVSIANTSNRPFLTKDIEMIIPVVKRVGIELKYNTTLELATENEKEAFQHGLRIIFHQLMSPIATMRNHILNISDKSLTEQKYKLRLEELLDNYSNFLDMLKSHQFFFDFLSSGYITPKFKESEEPFFTFINGKVRTYQLKAKAQKGLEIKIIPEEKPEKRGFRSDQELLSHVLQCLLDNAIKYSYNHLYGSTKTGNPNYAPPNVRNYIYLFLKNTAENFEIKIENWGCPIEPDEKEKIKKFQSRGAHAKSFDDNGSGIGLYVVDMIVHALRGQMHIIPKGDHTTIQLIFKHQ